MAGNFNATRPFIYINGNIIDANQNNPNENTIYGQHNASMHEVTGHQHTGAVGDAPPLGPGSIDLTANYNWTGIHTFLCGNLRIHGAGVGVVGLCYENTVNNRTHIIPDAGGNDIFAMIAAIQNISNKTFLDNLVWKAGIAFKGTLTHVNTADRIYTFQDKAGKVLLDTSVLVAGAGVGVATLIYENSANNRTHTIPDAGGNDTFAMLAAVQTLTNKTLISPKINTSINMTAGDVNVSMAASTTALKFGAFVDFDNVNGRVGLDGVAAPTVSLDTAGVICARAGPTLPDAASRGYLHRNNTVFCAGAGDDAGGQLAGTVVYNTMSYVRNAAGDYTVTFNVAHATALSNASACNLESPIVGARDGAIIITTTTTTARVGTLDATGVASDSDYSVYVLGA